MNIRPVMLWEFKQGKSANVTAEKLFSLHSEGLITDRAVRYWFAKFHSADMTLKDEPRAGCLFDFDDNLLKAILILKARDVAERLNKSQSTVCRHLEKLGKITS